MTRRLKEIRPPHSIALILRWADDYHERFGEWPALNSGSIPGTLGEKWVNVNAALRDGYRGLPGGSSLARLLVERRAARKQPYLPRLTIRQILAWADAFHEGTGEWPLLTFGPIPGSREETWGSIDTALRQGRRGLRGRSSLARLLAKSRGVRNLRQLPALVPARILDWADVEICRTGRRPKESDGTVAAAPHENWKALDMALRYGHRGLPGGSSLAKLLAGRKCRLRNPPEPVGIPQGNADNRPAARTAEPKPRPARTEYARYRQRRKRRFRKPPLTPAQILAWADRHHRRTGSWPKRGQIVDAPGENWEAVDAALRTGNRGLVGGSSLAQLLADSRGVRNTKGLPPLTKATILAWADAHRRRTGKWPQCRSGPIADAPGETWLAVERALNKGQRGLKTAGSSLAQLLAEERGVPTRRSGRP